MFANSRSLSACVSDSVGSSSTSTRALSASALAISTSWRLAVLRSLTRSAGSMSAPTPASCSRVQASALDIRGRSGAGIAKTMFSVTVRSSRIERCW